MAQRVAEGNYGTVFKATSKKTGGVVAYKLIENIEKVRMFIDLSKLALSPSHSFFASALALSFMRSTLSSR